MWGADKISQERAHSSQCMLWIGGVYPDGGDSRSSPACHWSAAEVNNVERSEECLAPNLSLQSMFCVCGAGWVGRWGVSACRWTGNNKLGLQRNLEHLTKCVCLIIWLRWWYTTTDQICAPVSKYREGRAVSEWLLLYFRVCVATPTENTMRSLRCWQPITIPADVKTLWHGLESGQERV